MANGQTHVDASTTGPKLRDGVVKVEELQAEGAAAGATAYVHYNGPTDQLGTMVMGMLVLDPGASPHPPHRHPEEEFMTVASGTGTILVGEQETAVGPGAVMYCAGDVLHGITNTGAGPMTVYFSKWAGRG